MSEVWKAVVGYEGAYEVSDGGNVRSLPHEKESYGGRSWMHKGKLLRPTLIKDKGYLVVSLHLDGKTTRKYVHDLVLTAFVGTRPNPKAHCCHGIEGPGVNRLENLRWDTPRENVMDKYRDGTMPLGEGHWKNVYTVEQICAVKGLLSAGCLSGAQIQAETGVKASTVQQIKKGRQWAHLACPIFFAEQKVA